ncbi:hypothetical protein [Egicoccus sp. AB-alg2]|uniref:hypothetical protein n=1 Tax=Egicoccus sp. AB-alg2 TaxID=3242693 RepID=UPI00359DC26E
MRRRHLSVLATAVALAVVVAQPAAAHHRPGHAGGPPPHAPGGPGTPGNDPAEDVSAPRVVVAAIDSGTNPYHEFFHAGGDGPYPSDAPPTGVTPDVLAEFGIGDDQVLHLTRTGDVAADLAADTAQWDAVQPGVPYWFAGTNVIGISFDTSTRTPLRPGPEKSAHGVGVAAAVLEANPEAVVVLVEGITDASEEWAFTHPAVDVVTTSYGPIGSPPLPEHLSFSHTGVVGNGKLHFGAVDNSPALSPIDSTGGPWWSIGVAGFQEHDTRGRQHLSGTASDFLGAFVQDLPYCMDCQSGRREVAGTSFATPTGAGVASLGILAARRAAGHVGGITGDERLLVAGDGLRLNNWQVRRALEEAAAYPALEEWDPLAFGSPLDAVGTPILDPAPWLTAGWGLLSADPDRGVVEELLARLGVAGEPTRTKDADTCTFMTTLFEARFAYWNTYAFLGESWLSDEDPYVRCPSR